jgi:NAD+ diphosphatase
MGMRILAIYAIFLINQIRQPFPANVMIGFYATADSSQPIRTDLDNELEGLFISGLLWQSLDRAADARWFSREEVLAVLAHRDGTNLSKRHPGGGSGAFAHSDPSIKHRINESGQQEEDSPPFVVPPKTAIAGVLISEWAHGRVKHLPQPEHQHGNL